MKSALEIAMEKTSAIGEKAREELEKLSSEQLGNIDEIKKIYEGKIAERNILFEQEIMKLTNGVPLEIALSQIPPEARAPIDDARQKHIAERETLEEERDRKIADIKKS